MCVSSLSRKRYPEGPPQGARVEQLDPVARRAAVDSTSLIFTGLLQSFAAPLVTLVVVKGPVPFGQRP